MRYVSTRGGEELSSFSATVLSGLASDGGLFVPSRIPRVSPDELKAWASLEYPNLACEILSKFLTNDPGEITQQTLDNIIIRTYNSQAFGTDEITPLESIGRGQYILDLSRGPTLAFKDVALQLLGNLFEHVLGKEGKTIKILGATSGDTGSAAEYAVRGKKGVGIVMLSPHNRMSPFQASQMYSLDDPNIVNIAINGIFDDCQDLVKEITRDAAFKNEQSLGAVNSINWARIAAQVVYYFKGYFELNRGNLGEIDVSVPTGNFGNILAGWYAKRMGLPIRRLILATNENNVLDEFFKTGVYNPRESSEVIQTSSPSMDISRASNFERFIYEMLNQDPHMTNKHFSNGRFNFRGNGYWRNVEMSGIHSGSSTHLERIATMQRVYYESGRLIDTHTADAVTVGLRKLDPDVPMFFLETAKAVKFEDVIKEAALPVPTRPELYVGLENRKKTYLVLEKGDVQGVKEAIRSLTLN